MAEERQLIRLIIEKMLNPATKVNESGLGLQAVDWGYFKELIVYHELTPFTYLAFKGGNLPIPEELQKFLKNTYYCAIPYCELLWSEFLRILTGFEQAKISLLPLKGVAFLKDIYLTMPFRTMTDIDLLIQEQDFKKAESLLADLDYRKELWGLKEEYWRKRQNHIAFYKNTNNSPFIEIHWSLDFKRKGRYVLPGLWSRLRTIDVDARKINLLSPEDTLFNLALHSRRYGKALCLKNVYDAALLLNKYSQAFDWDYCLRMGRNFQINSTLFFLLCQIDLISDIKIPKRVGKELKVPIWKRKLIRNFIEKFTFLNQKTREQNSLYLKSHFLLYDSLWEPIEYIWNIPKEQFAKYYRLKPYAKKTDFFYRNRHFYIPFQSILALQRNSQELLKHNLSLFQTQGFSMWPFVKAKEKLLIKPDCFASLKVGDIVLYQHQENLVAHRLIKIAKRKNEKLFFVRGDNCTSSPERINEAMFRGRAVGIIREGKIVNLTTRKQLILNRLIVVFAPLAGRLFRWLKPLYKQIKRRKSEEEKQEGKIN